MNSPIKPIVAIDGRSRSHEKPLQRDFVTPVTGESGVRADSDLITALSKPLCCQWVDLRPVRKSSIGGFVTPPITGS